MDRCRHKCIYFILIWALVSITNTSGCPSVCSCKWKGGKQSVECINKGLTKLPDEIEYGTQVLNFDGNNLQSLPRRAFLNRKLINLQKLHLSNCNLEKIHGESFAQLTNLVELDLSNNLLTTIPATSFRHIPALRHLNLAGNPIGSVPAHSFSHTPGLVYLDISDARINTVSPLAFQPLTLLETLQIQNNNIKELSETIINNLESLHGIRVHDNPWFCDCRALPLWRLLVVRRIPLTVFPTCNAPRRTAGTKFDELEEKDFACPPEIRPVIRFVQGVAGENATVTCPVEGQPPPKVLWFIGDRPVINGSILGLGPQRVYIVNGGQKNKISHLVITGAQEADSGQIRCIAVNPAGRATANFTLAVTMKAISKDPLNSGHIAGISIGLIVLALIIFVVAFILFARTRTTSSPTPAKERSPASSLPCSPSEPNPIQKPPRLTDLSSSNSTDPDLISEAEKVSRGNHVNGYIPSGRENAPSVSEIGDYTRMEGDSLYPSSLWDSQGPVIHEHYNPGFVSQETPHHIPIHSTPFKNAPEPNFDPQFYGYPSDYGLPIPEVDEESVYSTRQELSVADRIKNVEKKTPFLSREDMTNLKSNPYATPYTREQESPMYSLFNNELGPDIRIQENRIPEEVQLQEVESRVNVVEGAESPQVSGPPGERPWVPGSQNTPIVPLGVAVLPPLPINALHRIKARDSPDEGYQEGTEV
ncbi:UNVERIFIED_CONTAM: hypothetical protein GTU68_057333 [Idotea baltica]|nr:hypothetical protein [Idotea baltica]